MSPTQALYRDHIYIWLCDLRVNHEKPLVMIDAQVQMLPPHACFSTVNKKVERPVFVAFSVAKDLLKSLCLLYYLSLRIMLSLCQTHWTCHCLRVRAESRPMDEMKKKNCDPPTGNGRTQYPDLDITGFCETANLVPTLLASSTHILYTRSSIECPNFGTCGLNWLLHLITSVRSLFKFPCIR